MKGEKFLVFAIFVLATAVVVFNNATQLAKEIFVPEFNVGLWVSFAMITFGTVLYVVVNKDMLKGKVF